MTPELREIPQPDPNWKDVCAKCNDGEIEPKFCAYYGEPNGCNSPIYGKHPTAEKSSPVGNTAAMREALEKVVEIANREWDAFRETSAMWEMHEICTAALSAPPRNCDVGTAGEQYGRYIKFCNRRRLMKSDCDMDCPCAAKNFNDHFCQLEWAQMPYEEGATK